MSRRPPFFSSLRPTLHISHRGGAALAPENTLVAFRQAVELYRTDMLELDVHPTRDGELVVAHDASVERCTEGTGLIAEHTFDELRRLDAGYRFSPDDGLTFPFRGRGVTIPRLADVLRAFPSVRLNIELKAAAPGQEHLFVHLLRAERAIDRVCCGSESDEIAARLHEAAPDACHFYPRDALTAFILSCHATAEPPNDDRYSVLDMPLEFGGMRLFTEKLRTTALRLGKWVNVWTINDVAEMRRLIGEGVGGIMTDRPDLLRSVLQAS